MAVFLLKKRQQQQQQQLHYEFIVHTCDKMMAPIMNLVERAAELNEDGVYELAEGSFPDAVQSFENAVRQMMQVCEQTTQAHHLHQHQHQHQHAPLKQQQQHQHQQQCCTNTSSIAPSCLPASRSNVEVPYLKDDRFFLYSCTVTFQPPASSSAVPSSAEIAFYCATILFNLALAHHQQGQRTSGEDRLSALRHAMQLYQEAAKALHTLQQRMTPPAALAYREDLLLLHLAIWNNQACILVVLGNVHAADACFQHVLVQSRMALDADEDLELTRHNFSIFEQSQIQEFLRNAMVFGTLHQAGGVWESAAACA
jgi:tetratricopeptide (TPR) repeat protein